jgi:hypothetical protein
MIYNHNNIVVWVIIACCRLPKRIWSRRRFERSRQIYGAEGTSPRGMGGGRGVRGHLPVKIFFETSFVDLVVSK